MMQRLSVVTVSAALVTAGCRAKTASTRPGAIETNRLAIRSPDQARLLAVRFLEERGLKWEVPPGEPSRSGGWVFLVQPPAEGDVPVGSHVLIKVQEDGEVEAIPGA
jgi:hypothetical protein